jgi:tellurite methyltransferase
MEEDRMKWNDRYSGEEYFFSLGPSKLLAAKIGTICSLIEGRRALDLACGEGRNAIFLAQQGFEVDAIDIAERGLERGRNRAKQLGVAVNFLHADLEQYRLQRQYDLILDFNFLLRPLIPDMVSALAPRGVILMETILSGPTLQGHHREEFLLQPGELGRLFTGYPGEILLLEEDQKAAQSPVARIMFHKKGLGEA